MTFLIEQLVVCLRLTAVLALALTLTFDLCLIAARAQGIREPAKSAVTFAEVPPRTSGITWVHDNAHSSQRHLPETVVAGYAFFDYVNDGCMEIYPARGGL